MAKTRQARTAAGKARPKRGEIYLTALAPTVGRAINKTGLGAADAPVLLQVGEAIKAAFGLAQGVTDVPT